LASALSMVQKAEKMPVYAKILAYGPMGTGKTINGLMMPSPVLAIDIEKGSVHYGGAYDFYVQRTRNLAVIKNTLLELRENKCHIPVFDDNGNEVDKVRINSLVIDSGSTLYHLVTQYWIQKFQRERRDPAYQLAGSDYTQVKSDFWINYINPLLDMDIHVYLICRRKNNYLPGTFMKINPENPYCPDIEASVPHEFDVVLHMTKDANDVYRADVDKSRVLDPKTRLSALPDVFENIDKDKFIPELIQFITKHKVYDRSGETKREMSAKTTADAMLDDLRSEIYGLIERLGWDGNKGKDECIKVTGIASPRLKTFTLDKAQLFVDYLRGLVTDTEATVDEPTVDE
jgi:hypothetical protein